MYNCIDTDLIHVLSASRFCNRDGMWDEIICYTSENFKRISQEVSIIPSDVIAHLT